MDMLGAIRGRLVHLVEGCEAVSLSLGAAGDELSPLQLAQTLVDVDRLADTLDEICDRLRGVVGD